jgi:hypothetical protein
LFKVPELLFLEHHLRKRLDAGVAELPENDLLELEIKDIGLEYMSRGMFMGTKTSVQDTSCILLKKTSSNLTKMES